MNGQNRSCSNEPGQRTIDRHGHPVDLDFRKWHERHLDWYLASDRERSADDTQVIRHLVTPCLGNRDVLDVLGCVFTGSGNHVDGTRGFHPWSKFSGAVNGSLQAPDN